MQICTYVRHSYEILWTFCEEQQFFAENIWNLALVLDIYTEGC